MASAINNGTKMTPQEAREMYDLKHQAMAYYKENGVPQKMEEILNSTFYDKPSDVFGHLANYFQQFAATPKITKVVGREVLDGRGRSSVQTEIYCMVGNHEKLISTSVSSNQTFPPDSMKPEEREAVEVERKKSVAEAVDLINSVVNDSVRDKDPTQQREMDAVLMHTFDIAERLAKEREESGEDAQVQESTADLGKSPRSTDSKAKAKSPKGKNKAPAVVITPDEPRETLLSGCSFLSATSQAVATAAADIKDEPLYKHIATARDKEAGEEKLHVPLPMVTILMSGKVAPGKLNSVKEFMVVPRPGMPLKESAKHIVGIYNHCAKVLSAKTGIVAKAVNDIGALWTTFDRPEQGLDLLQEAITQQQLTPGEDFNIALNCAGHEIFDYEKGKYEVIVGQQKPGEDLADYWGDILNRYPSIIALIDPLRKVDSDAWTTLAERVSERCYVVSDVAAPRPALFTDQEDSTDCKTSAMVLRLENMNTVSDLISATAQLQDTGKQTILSTAIGESTDTFLADLAVGLRSRFLKLGAPNRGERTNKINRLLQIEASLEAEESLITLEPHVFPRLKPPTPPPAEEEGDTETKSESATTN